MRAHSLALFVLAGTVASHEVHKIANCSCGRAPFTLNTKNIVRFAGMFVNIKTSFCSGNPHFVTNRTLAPANFCTATKHRTGRFDQFLLEAHILTRWHASSREFSENVVLAPSIFFECSINASVKKPTWMKSWQLQGAHAPNMAEKLFRSYWSKLRLSLAPQNKLNPYVYPWTVVTLGFANDGLSEKFLNTLLEQPSSFASRVIIGSLEGSHMLLRQQREYEKVPASLRPNFVSLPYPVGIESAVRFTESSGAYRPSSRRPIAILLYWEKAKNGGDLGVVVSMRSNLSVAYDRLPAASSGIRLGGSGRRTIRAVVCEPGGGGGGVGGGGTACHSAADLVAPATIYDATVSSDFCLQPIGDTPTRSHFYLAVLSGCIPVIFDDARGSVTTRGHWAAGGLEGTHGTRWAWRGTAGFELDYRSFTVVYEAEELEHDLRQGRILEELTQMPGREPGRFEALRRGVDDAARTMRYSLRECSDGEIGQRPCDAFTAFEEVIEATIAPREAAEAHW